MYNTKKRMLLYIMGLFILSMAIAFSIRSQLGVSPVSSIPYVVSSITGLTVGTVTFFFYLLCVIAQIIILRKDFKPRNLLQIVFSSVFGIFTDLSLYLTAGLSAPNYFSQLVFLGISLMLIAIGLSLILITDVIINAPEGLCNAIVAKWGIKFSKIKTAFDISCVSISIVLALVFLGNLTQIREGTIIAAIFVGRIVGLVMDRYKERIKAFYTVYPLTDSKS